jgi:tetratricopeptide (TPR) repeat protein
MIYLPHAQRIIGTFNMELSKTKESEELLWRLLYNLGECSQLQGKYAEAEAMYRQTLQLQETVLGKDHPDSLAYEHDESCRIPSQILSLKLKLNTLTTH